MPEANLEAEEETEEEASGGGSVDVTGIKSNSVCERGVGLAVGWSVHVAGSGHASGVSLHVSAA